MNPSNPPIAGPSRLGLAMILMVLTGAAIVLYLQGDRLGAATMIPLALGALAGYQCGAWRMFGLFAATSGGCMLAQPTAQRLVPWIESQFQYTFPKESMGLAISGLVAMLGITIVLALVRSLVINRFVILCSIDQNLGMTIGLVKAGMLMAIGLWTLQTIEPRLEKLHHQVSQRTDPDAMEVPDRAIAQLKNLHQVTRQSPLLAYVGTWNPIEKQPRIKAMFEKAEAALNEFNAQQGADHAGGLAASRMTSLFNDLQSQLNMATHK